MLEYIKDKYKEVSGEVKTKENVVQGVGSIGYIDLNTTITIDMLATLVLAELDNKGETLPLLIKDYQESGVVVKIMKEELNKNLMSLRCYFDMDNENFVQINVINNNIDSVMVFKRYDRLFFNKAEGVFIDSKTNEKYEKSLWLDVIIGDTQFFINKDEQNVYIYDRVFNNKEVIKTNMKDKDHYVITRLTECLYHRGISSDSVNRELLLLSNLESEKENSMNIYIGLDVPITNLKII